MCKHADIVLPEALPPMIARVMNRRVAADDIDGLADLRQAIVRATYLAKVVSAFGTRGAPVVDEQFACALMRSHPDIAAWGAMSFAPGAACTVARRIWEAGIPRTELGIAERVALLHGADLAHTPDLGGWLTWDGTRWAADPAGTTVMRTVSTIVGRDLDREAAGLPEGGDDGPDLRSAMLAFARKAATAKVIRATIDLTRAQPEIAAPAGEWDQRPDLLPVANGTLELREGEAKLRAHDRADRLTRVARAAYRPRADRGAWHGFLDQVLPDDAVRTRVQRVAGYSLYGANTERLLVILLGPTTTGKTTFCEVVGHALGEYGGPFDLGLFRGSREGGSPRSDLLTALPRRFVHTAEASDRWELHADQVKRLTGGDLLSARGVYARTGTEARPGFTPWIATNEAPRIVGADTALWRRLEVLPFTEPVAREDPGLGDRLRADRDAVLAWLVEGWEQYSAHGFGPVPEACKTATASLRADLSLIDRWLAEDTEDAVDAETPASEIGGRFYSWQVRNHVAERDMINTIALGKGLTARGYGSVMTGPKESRVRARTGLRLVDHSAKAGMSERTDADDNVPVGR